MTKTLTCPVCHEREKARDRLRRLRAQRRAAGVCDRCGVVPVERFNKCQSCRSAESAYGRQRYRERVA